MFLAKFSTLKCISSESNAQIFCRTVSPSFLAFIVWISKYQAYCSFASNSERIVEVSCFYNGAKKPYTKMTISSPGCESDHRLFAMHSKRYVSIILSVPLCFMKPRLCFGSLNTFYQQMVYGSLTQENVNAYQIAAKFM